MNRVKLTLVPPQDESSGGIIPSADQEQLLSAPRSTGSTMLWGAPGTGKTTALVELVARRINDDGVHPDQVFFLTSSRSSADRLRTCVAARIHGAVQRSPVRSWAAFAFSFLQRIQQDFFADTLAPPRLLSGAEQDAIIAELLAGHRQGLVPGPLWPESLTEAVNTRGFRQELRNLFDRLTDHGLGAEEFSRVAKTYDRQEWEAAAHVFSEYQARLGVDPLTNLHDPAELIRAAAYGVQEYPRIWEEMKPQLIVVDDFQDATETMQQFLSQLSVGVETVIAASPDTAVQGFRGARPDTLAQLADNLDARQLVLNTSHRMLPEVMTSWQRVAQRIPPAAGKLRLRELQSAPSSASKDELITKNNIPHTALVVSEVQQRQYIAERIQHYHVTDERPLNEIAVIMRSGAQLASLSRFLDTVGIAHQVPAANVPLTMVPAVQSLLMVVEFLLHPERVNATGIVELLTSRLGGMHSLDIRRLRYNLRGSLQELGAEYSHREYPSQGNDADSALVEAMQHPEELKLLGVEGGKAARVAKIWAAGRKEFAAATATPSAVLWSMWEAAGVSDDWAATALDSGVEAARANQDLDAMMALFHLAERATEQQQAPANFFRNLQEYELPMDTLAHRGQSGPAVQLHTPASASGLEWPVVILAGLQEGVWPDLRLRGEILASQYLVDLLELGETAAKERTVSQKIQQIRYDELRSFSAALSRASEQLLCVAVSSEEEQPSSFIDVVDPWNPTADDEVRPLVEVSRPKNLRALVAELRQASVSPASSASPTSSTSPASPEAQIDSESRVAHEAAAVLAILAKEGVPGAGPDAWWGLPSLSTEEPIITPGTQIRVSPSRLETILTSPLDWLLQTAVGTQTADVNRNLGSLVHALAQDYPTGNIEELQTALDKHWSLLDAGSGWQAHAQYRKIRQMLMKFAEYIQHSMKPAARRLLAAEQDFQVPVPLDPSSALREHNSLILTGVVDRLEQTENGELYLVDLKTGKHPPALKEMPQHLQLAAYQAAIQLGAFAEHGAVSAGAALLGLGGATQKFQLREQAALSSEDEWIFTELQHAAGLLSAADFPAIFDPALSHQQGRGCAISIICPFCYGKQVTE